MHIRGTLSWNYRDGKEMKNGHKKIDQWVQRGKEIVISRNSTIDSFVIDFEWSER